MDIFSRVSVFIASNIKSVSEQSTSSRKIGPEPTPNTPAASVAAPKVDDIKYSTYLFKGI